MVLVVERESAEPVYGQIARQVRERIVNGRLAAGTPLPAVRTLASDLGVNLNTVARAYRQLEEQGFLQIRDRSGAEVTAPPPAARSADRRRLTAELREVLERMRQAGMRLDDLRRVVSEEVERLDAAGRSS
jgi:DNA-binding transcriptional regulator YhcF (GntR family)